ncbi:hypothetical protein J6590_070756 [Homalodisca vitripennis]|nr:hypothetical protein J6590_070756 [Homalodisca vitripennis]
MRLYVHHLRLAVALLAYPPPTASPRMPLAYPRLDARQLTAHALSARLCSIRFAFNASLLLIIRLLRIN